MSQSTKELILAAARELIQRVGVNAMSYKDLSEIVGIRKASIHYHFPKKEDLIVALLTQCHVEYGAAYRKIIASGENFRAKLMGIVDLFEASLCAGKVCVIGMLSAEYATLGEPVREAADAAIEQTVRILEVAFIGAAHGGLLPRDLDTYAAAHGFFGQLLGAQILARCRNNPSLFRTMVETQLSILPGF